MELSYNNGTVLALGNFDGLHIGHMAVVNSAKTMAGRCGATPCVVTFSEHPLKILKGEAPKELFTGSVRERAFEKTGASVCSLDFKSLMNMSPEDFFNKIILEMLGARGVCCGFNYNFGAKGAGTPELLEELCKKNSINFYMAPATVFEGEPVSSTRIRKALVDGEIELANMMLGRPFTYSQLVVDGDKRGRILGAPTINQHLSESLIEPKHGVYMSKCYIEGKKYYSVTNLGTRPTIGNGPVSSETYILDFDGDLYGKYVDVCLLKYIRPERKFDNLDALETQIKCDSQKVREILKQI